VSKWEVRAFCLNQIFEPRVAVERSTPVQLQPIAGGKEESW
jgi:hypothetical protein